YEVGEGEKKIMNYIKAKLIEKKGKILVYSPDADVILLCMLLDLKDNYILRYDPMQDKTSLINVNVLKENISYYVKEELDSKEKDKNKNIQKIINDIVLLSVFFGNDFIPNIVSINVKDGFKNIIDAYIKTKKKENDNLVTYKNDTYHLNLDFLKKVIYNLLPVENDFIENNNVYNKYIKAGSIKNVFSDLNITMESIEKIVNEFKRDYGNLCNDIKNNANLGRYLVDTEFMDHLKKCIDINYNGSTVNVSNLSNQELLSAIKKYYTKTQKFPRLFLSLNTYSKSIDDRYHRMQIDKMQKELRRPLNNYEKEKYKFDNMTDHYQTKFNAFRLDLSKKGVKKYYRKYFDVELSYNDDKLDSASKSIMYDYLQGLVWVFEYYYNDLTYVNTWCYMHEKAPILKHLSLYLNKIDESDLNNITKSLKKYQVTDLDKYFNPIIQLIYVSPMNSKTIKLLPENYQELINSKPKELSKFFINTKKVVSNLKETKESANMDCRSIRYFNKCLLKEIQKPTRSDDKLFIEIMNNVKPNDESKKRSRNNFPEY
ncbi:MAG: hypothetical protein H0X03_08380, partial [Nitrosopumilus sp.]|nr:hypothetical protein [Nitrosopumilus sp.]